MRYWSTRGGEAQWSLMEGFLLGLAPEGGLLVPTTFPQVSERQLGAWSELSFVPLMDAVFRLFGMDIEEERWQAILARSYASFAHPHITPVVALDRKTAILELFHGPTFAFKDVALQLMGQLYAYASEQLNEKIHIIGATSGDTGAAAIAGVRGVSGIRICVLHPHNKVSHVQQLQMTTVLDDNVLNLAVQGTFDDCQRIIKELFGRPEWKGPYALRAINSINIVRIIAQMVYYVYAYFRVREQYPQVSTIDFVVPTGNFGNALSAFWVRKIGVPIGRIVVATNENDVLARLIREGVYETGAFRTTPSPSMDIQVASNFERYVYHLLDHDRQAVAEHMKQFHATGKLVFSEEKTRRIQQDFATDSITNERTIETIAGVWQRKQRLIDPHTACAMAAAQVLPTTEDEVVVVVATAHPAKFDESIQAICPNQPVPEPIARLANKPMQMRIVEATTEAVAHELASFLV